MSNTTPTLDTSSPRTFAAYLIDQALGDPRTKAMIGCGIRWILHGAGVALAARPVGHLFQSVASNSDWIMLAAGVVLSAGQLVWGLYQKWRVDRKLSRLNLDLDLRNDVLEKIAPEIVEEAHASVCDAAQIVQSTKDLAAQPGAKP